ncbi:hypothetical protein [Cloacibacillus porcorum]
MDDTKRWRFQVPGGLLSRKTLTLEEKIDFWLEKQQEWFYGYTTAEDGVKGVLWGKKIDLYVDIRPFGPPIDLLAQPSQPVRPKTKQQNPRRLQDPEKQAYVERVQAKLAELRAQFPPPVTREIEERCIAYFGNEKLILPMAEVFKVWADGSLELADKCRKTAPVLGGMKDLFADVKLPDELMRDDTKFCEGLCKLLQLAQTVEATAEQQQVEVGSDLAEMIRCLDRLTDRMIEGGERLWNAPRKMTPEEYDAYIDKSIDAEYSGKHLSERLKLLEELWEDPLVDMQERAEYMETAIKAAQSEGRKKAALPCPHKEAVQQHLSALAKRLDALEQEGESAWQRRAAQEMETTCRAWREDAELPALSLEEFAAGLRVSSLITKTITDETGAIHIRLEITFIDKRDSFAGHWITATVEDDLLKSVDLEG